MLGDDPPRSRERTRHMVGPYALSVVDQAPWWVHRTAWSQPLDLWLHRDLPHRVEREFKVPVEWVEARSDDLSEPTVPHISLAS